MASISRRHLLASTGLVTAGLLSAAGAGATIAALSDLPARTGTGPGPGSATGAAPADSSAHRAEVAALTTALARENELVGAVSGAMAVASTDPRAAELPMLLADHRAHAAAITALIASPGSSPGSVSSSGSAALTMDELRAAEQAAGAAGTELSATLRSAAAVLLASIAACEAGHVELMS